MKTMITGGAGFIGSNAASRYLRRGNHVVVVDNLCRGVFKRISSGSKRRARWSLSGSTSAAGPSSPNCSVSIGMPIKFSIWPRRLPLRHQLRRPAKISKSTLWKRSMFWKPRGKRG